MMTSPFELKAQPNFLTSYDDIPPEAGGPIYSPSQNDVLSGRGGRINSHKGNVYFRHLVSHYRDVYLSPKTRKLDKIKVAEQLVMQIRRLDPPGRFLKEGSVKDGQIKGAWYEIGDFKARKKAGQAMREKVKEEKEGGVCGVGGKVPTLEDIANRDTDKLPSVSSPQQQIIVAPVTLPTPSILPVQEDPLKLAETLNSMAPPVMGVADQVIASLPNNTNFIRNDLGRRVSNEAEPYNVSNNSSGSTTPEEHQQVLPTTEVVNGNESYDFLNDPNVVNATMLRNSLTVDDLGGGVASRANQFHHSRVTQVSENSEEIALRTTDILYTQRQEDQQHKEPNRVSINSELSDKTFQTTNQPIVTSDTTNNLAHYYTDDQCPTPPSEPEQEQQQYQQEEDQDHEEESQLHPCKEIDTPAEDYDAMVSMMSLGSFSIMDTNVSLSSLPDKDKIFGSCRGGTGGSFRAGVGAGNTMNATTEEEDVVNSDDKMPSPKMMTKKDRQRFFLQRDESYNGSGGGGGAGSGGSGSGSGGLSRKDRQRSFLTRDSSTLGDRGSTFSMQRSSYSTSLPSADEIEDVNPIVHAYQQSRNKTASVSAMSISMGSLSLMDNGASYSNMFGSAMNTVGGTVAGGNIGGAMGNNMPTRDGLTNTSSSPKNNSSVESNSQQSLEEESMSMVSHESLLKC